MVNKLFKVLSFLMIGLLVSPIALAANGELPEASVNPSSRLYLLKEIGENFKITTALTGDRKAQVYMDFAEERLSEILSIEDPEGLYICSLLEEYNENIDLVFDSVKSEDLREKLLKQTISHAKYVNQITQTIDRNELKHVRTCAAIHGANSRTLGSTGSENPINLPEGSDDIITEIGGAVENLPTIEVQL